MAKRRNHLRVVTGAEAVPDRVFTQPSVRASILWTASGIQTAERSADSGDMWRLGDLVDQILADERFGELLDTLASLALGSELTFEKGPGEKLGEAELADELREDYREGWPVEELALFTIYKVLAGFAFARHEGYFTATSGRMVPRFRAWHPKHFRWDAQRRTWLWKDEMGRQYPFTPGDGEWVAGYRRGEFRPWAQGAWRGLARWWLLKAYAINDWGIHSEKASKLILTAADGVEPETRRQLADDILRAAKDTIISLPVGFNMNLIELSANTESIYKAQIATADEAAAIAILGQNLSTKVEGGSYAAAQVHAAKENRKVAYVAQSLGLELQRQSLPFWTAFNFGDGAEVPFPRYNTDPPEDKTEKVATLSTLATALVTLKQAGFKLSADTIEKDYGFQLEELSAEELAATQPDPLSPPQARGRGGAVVGKERPRAPVGSGATNYAPDDSELREDYEHNAQMKKASGRRGDQPRVPAGNSHGGEFAPKNGGWAQRTWNDEKRRKNIEESENYLKRQRSTGGSVKPAPPPEPKPEPKPKPRAKRKSKPKPAGDDKQPEPKPEPKPKPKPEPKPKPAADPSVVIPAPHVAAAAKEPPAAPHQLSGKQLDKLDAAVSDLRSGKDSASRRAVHELIREVIPNAHRRNPDAHELVVSDEAIGLDPRTGRPLAHGMHNLTTGTTTLATVVVKRIEDGRRRGHTRWTAADDAEIDAAVHSVRDAENAIEKWQRANPGKKVPDAMGEELNRRHDRHRALDRKRDDVDDYAAAVSTLVHEELHDYGSPGAHRYTASGAAIEEVTTEVLARRIVSRSMGAEEYRPHGAYAREIQDAYDIIKRHTGLTDQRAWEVMVAASAHHKTRGQIPTPDAENFARSVYMAALNERGARVPAHRELTSDLGLMRIYGRRP